MKKIISSSLAALFLLVLSFGIFATATHANIVSNSTFNSVTVDNSAGVHSTVGTVGNTGGNTTISNGGDAKGNNATGGSASNTVETGNADANSTVTNCVNTTVINGVASPCVNATPTPAPTATPVPGNNGGGSNGGGGSSSGGGSGSSGSGSTQAVLGEMAATGTFEENMMNTFGVLGIGLMFLGFVVKHKKFSL